MSTEDVESYTLYSLSDLFLLYQPSAGTLGPNVWLLSTYISQWFVGSSFFGSGLYQHTGKRASAGVIWLFACSHLVRFMRLFPSHFESNKAIYAPLWSQHTHFTVPGVVYLTKLANEVKFLAAVFSHTPLILGILQDVPTHGWGGRWLILVPVTVDDLWSVQPSYWPCKQRNCVLNVYFPQ